MYSGPFAANSGRDTRLQAQFAAKQFVGGHEQRSRNTQGMCPMPSAPELARKGALALALCLLCCSDRHRVDS